MKCRVPCLGQESFILYKLPKILKIKFGYIANSRVIKYVSKLYISMPGVNQAKMICCWQKYDGRVCQNNTAK